jgi:hypothetical protein
MARMRTVKPEAFTSLSLSDVERGIRWTFAGLWTHCDDEGRAAFDARLLKASIYPLDDSVTIPVISSDMAHLERVGAVCFYVVGGRQYVHVPAWHDHQHPNRKVESKLPACPYSDHRSVLMQGYLTEDAVSPHSEATESLIAQQESAAVSPHVQRSEDAVSEQGGLTSVVVVEGRVDVDGEGVVAVPNTTRQAAPRGVRIPSNWTPALAEIEWARAHSVSDELARYETEKFRDFWIGKSGKDATKTDWGATWRNWMRRAIEQGATGKPTTNGASAKAQGWLDIGSQPLSIEGRTA